MSENEALKELAKAINHSSNDVFELGIDKAKSKSETVEFVWNAEKQTACLDCGKEFEIEVKNNE